MNPPAPGECRSGFTNRPVKAVTFRGKLDLPIHRWYRLTPSFSPRLADDIADYFGLGPDDLVLDPFSGVGTVPLCMKYRGIPACSIEWNPYLHFVGTVKTRTYLDLGRIESCVGAFLDRYRSALRELPAGESGAIRYLREHAKDVPKISKPERWWSPKNLAQLVCLRRLLLDDPAEPHHLYLLKMGALGILVPVSNARHDHVSLTFAAEPAPTFDVGSVLDQKYREMTEDLRAVSGRPCAEIAAYRGNIKEVSRAISC